VVYLKKDFIAANPNTTQRLVNAHVKALKWLATATPEQVADTVPTEYHFGDKPLYLRAVKNSLESYSRTGIIPQAGQESVLDMLRKLDPEMASAKIDLAATFTDRFVKQASA
jgi:NitT/TauT family transport system substrate-binding protein